MARYALFLRGINVGGRKLVAMAALRALLEREGFHDVVTLLQSGNAVFSGDALPTSAIEGRLRSAIGRELGVDCDVFVRTAEEWSALREANPFPAAAAAAPAHLVVVLFAATPAEGGLEALRAAIPGREAVAVEGRALYAVYPDGIGPSKLTLPLVERHLGTRGTARNWSTVEKVAEQLGRAVAESAAAGV